MSEHLDVLMAAERRERDADRLGLLGKVFGQEKPKVPPWMSMRLGRRRGNRKESELERMLIRWHQRREVDKFEKIMQMTA